MIVVTTGAVAEGRGYTCRHDGVTAPTGGACHQRPGTLDAPGWTVHSVPPIRSVPARRPVVLPSPPTVAMFGSKGHASPVVIQPDPDYQLLSRIVAGQTDAMDALYERHAGVVFSVIFRVVHERTLAEDVLQEAFIRAWQHAGSFDAARGQVRPWLVRIGHNLALNELRRQRHRAQSHHTIDVLGTDRALDAVADPAPGPAQAAMATARRAEVDTALDDLPEEQRAVLLLYAEGYTQPEIAERTSAPLGTVKSRMRLGLRRLRDRLPDEMPGPD